LAAVLILGCFVVFGDQAMTLAVVDRLVHHATIFEMNAESMRQRELLDEAMVA
jgi:DNA replication protein DnaC